MTIQQLNSKLNKETKKGNGNNPVLIRIWVEDGADGVEIEEDLVYCSDAIVLQPKVKLTEMGQYIKKVKGFMSESIKKLNKMFNA